MKMKMPQVETQQLAQDLPIFLQEQEQPGHSNRRSLLQTELHLITLLVPYLYREIMPLWVLFTKMRTHQEVLHFPIQDRPMFLAERELPGHRATKLWRQTER